MVIIDFSMASREIIRVLKEQRPKKLFKHLYQLPNFGIGRRFTRVIWKHDSVPEGEERWGDPFSYWTITNVKPDGVNLCAQVTLDYYSYYEATKNLYKYILVGLIFMCLL